MADGLISSASVGLKKMKSKSTKLRPSLSSVLLFLCLATATAQGQVRLKINLVAWGNDIRGLTLKTASGEPITARSFAYNKSIAYSGPQDLAIYQGEVKEDASAYSEHYKPAGAIPEEKEEKIDVTKVKDPFIKMLLERKLKEPELVSLVRLPVNSREITILLAPATQGVYQPYLINADSKSSPAGALAVHNLSGYPVRVEQLNGKQQCQLDPKGKFLLAADEKKAFRYKISYQDGDRWRVATNNIVRLPEDQKTQLIVLQSDNEYFKSTDGSKSGFLQVVVLKRKGS